MRLIDLRERRAAVVDEMRGLLSSGELNDEGRSRFETLKAENERLEQDITRAEYLAEAGGAWRRTRATLAATARSSGNAGRSRS